MEIYIKLALIVIMGLIALWILRKLLAIKPTIVGIMYMISISIIILSSHRLYISEEFDYFNIVYIISAIIMFIGSYLIVPSKRKLNQLSGKDKLDSKADDGKKSKT